MSDHQPKSNYSDKLNSEVATQVALLRFEVHRLKSKIEQNADALADAAIREEQLKASFSVAMAERHKILTSRSWRIIQVFQRFFYVPRKVLLQIKLFFSGLNRKPSRSAEDFRAPGFEEKTSHATNPYEEWVNNYDTISHIDKTKIKNCIDELESRPLVSLLLADQNLDPSLSNVTLSSIRQQLYPHWEICSDYDSITNGSYIAVLEPGDILPEHALYEVIAEFQSYPDAVLVYTDEDKIDAQGRRHSPILKPAFNIDLQLATSLTGSLSVYRRSILDATGLTLRDIAGPKSQMAVVKIAYQAGAAHIRHISAILCHRLTSEIQKSQLSFPQDMAALEEQIAPIEISPIKQHSPWNRVVWPLPTVLPKVSIIIPTRDRPELLIRCILGLLYRTDYPDIELLIIDNDSIDVCTISLFRMLQMDPRVRIVSSPGPFNYSALNNAAAKVASGDIFLLLNNDVDVIDESWLKEMVSHALRPDVGVVGAKLLFANGSIQHAGVVLGVGQHNAGPGVAGHFGLSMDAEDPGYLGQFAMTREVSAVTGACLAVRKDVYNSVGGLNEDDLAISFNDVDFCLRVKETGLRIIWTAFSVLYHLESASRGPEKTQEQIKRAAREADYMRDRWGPILDNDPFYNSAFDRKDHTFELARAPRLRKLCAKEN